MRTKLVIMIVLVILTLSGCIGERYSGYIQVGNPIVGGSTITFEHAIFRGCSPDHRGFFGNTYYDCTINGQIYQNVNYWYMMRDQ